MREKEVHLKAYKNIFAIIIEFFQCCVECCIEKRWIIKEPINNQTEICIKKKVYIHNSIRYYDAMYMKYNKHSLLHECVYEKYNNRLVAMFNIVT